jgi:hypothetical protein
MNAPCRLMARLSSRRRRKEFLIDAFFPRKYEPPYVGSYGNELYLNGLSKRMQVLIAGLGLYAFLAAAGPARSNYDLSHTDGMESFAGSAKAREVLAAQGFVVAAPEFNQMFQPYIESPLPVLITVDSAWHTYHFLLEQGERELEMAQIGRLAQFSRLLLAAAKSRAADGSSAFGQIAAYASVGLALQDHGHLASLQPEERRLVEALLSGSTPVQAPIGFQLSPAVFRAQEFYTESPELKAFYAAWQWYATVDFRLSDKRETGLALRLSWLIAANPDLLALWKKLNEPYDTLLGPPVDGTITGFLGATQSALGTNFDLAGIEAHSAEIQKKLRAIPWQPRITDQILSLAEYRPITKLTAGFRLLPARQLPDAICLRRSVDPFIPQRLSPSGLDFMVGSPEMRSPAALRVSEKQFGKTVSKAVLKSDPGPMPDSLYGESMELLAGLQKPLPSTVPAPFRTEAWADLQLWTQLGAWAEQRHTWWHRATPVAEKAEGANAPPGIVEPYPDFFAALAKLARRTADALDLDGKSLVPPRLIEFAKICEHLAELARKELDGQAPTPEEAQWMSGYGAALAGLQFQEGKSGRNPRDDFACVTRIFNMTGAPYVLCAGVARPQALYVILPLKGRLQLYRGAVLSYREFAGYKNVNLDDEGWQRIIRARKTPAAPAFTTSFLRTD